jgi:hypothetical protein
MTKPGSQASQPGCKAVTNQPTTNRATGQPGNQANRGEERANRQYQTMAFIDACHISLDGSQVVAGY